MATRAEIDELKECWCYEPTWDIEDSEGFAEHAEELKAFRLEMEAQWEREFQAELREYAMKIELDANLKLAEKVRQLEERLESLETIQRIQASGVRIQA